MAPDDWMLQFDVRELLEKSPIGPDGYLTIHEKRESHIERRFTIFNPLPRRHCLASIKGDHTSSEDTIRVRFPVVRSSEGVSREIQISPRFWKYLKKRGINAALDENGSSLFEWRRDLSGGTAVTRFWIKEDILRDDLERHRLWGLWCTESILFSEKSLADLGLSETREVFRSDAFVYQLFIGHRPTFHFRMQTASIVLGKRILSNGG
jgi:hypothetical protein